MPILCVVNDPCHLRKSGELGTQKAELCYLRDELKIMANEVIQHSAALGLGVAAAGETAGYGMGLIILDVMDGRCAVLAYARETQHEKIICSLTEQTDDMVTMHLAKKDAADILEPMTKDPSDFVRQGCHFGNVSMRKKVADKHENPMARFNGAILCRVLLTVTPKFEFISNAKPCLFAYPSPTKPPTKVFIGKAATAGQSTTMKAKARERTKEKEDGKSQPKAEAKGGINMNVDEASSSASPAGDISPITGMGCFQPVRPVSTRTPKTMMGKASTVSAVKTPSLVPLGVIYERYTDSGGILILIGQSSDEPAEYIEVELPALVPAPAVEATASPAPGATVSTPILHRMRMRLKLAFEYSF
ncbi:hypothetical protein DFH11DRAFT_1545478 [Phellopilus nigrolimitatus]|nr:hypothetical protein DFH11DRAFT_1545478 [Phellopilus nigrolimitatus]